MPKNVNFRCQSCEGVIQPLPLEAVEKFLAQGRGWELVGIA